MILKAELHRGKAYLLTDNHDIWRVQADPLTYMELQIEKLGRVSDEDARRLAGAVPQDGHPVLAEVFPE